MRLVPFTVITWLGILLIAGVVLDGGLRVSTLQDAQGIAQSAARAGTNAATGTSVNGDAFDINASMAITAAQNYLTSAGMTGTTTVDGDTVTVTVETTYTPLLLNFGPVTVEATGTARLIGG